jgi:RloB-like protein
MGSDDLFKVRKARKFDELARQKKDRAQNQRFLIVCEGTKTEPYYLNDLVNDLGIRHHTVKIAPNNGSSPDRVVAHAIELYDLDAGSGDSFDKVFCVFDKDKHTTFDAAVRTITDMKTGKSPKPFVAITSNPCFEYWLLLHFHFTDKPFHAAGKKSVADQVVSLLKTKPGFTKYSKGQNGIYSLVKNSTSKAITYAKRGRKNAGKTGQISPLTNVDVLVTELRALVNHP